MASRRSSFDEQLLINTCFSAGFTCEVDDITPNLDKLAGLTGFERMKAAREQRIGSTMITAEEQAKRTHAARMASPWASTPRVDPIEAKREAAAQHEAAIVARAREVAAEEAATQRAEVEARALARATAEIMKGTHV